MKRTTVSFYQKVANSSVRQREGTGNFIAPHRFDEESMKTLTASIHLSPNAVNFCAWITIALHIASLLLCAQTPPPPGTLDSTFASRVDGPITTILTQPDGHLLVCGAFGFPGISSNLVRLTPDGVPDATFAASSAVRGMTKLAMQSDGKILVGKKCGVFRSCYAEGLSRLLTNGSEDPSLDFPMPPDSGSGAWSGFWTMALAVQPDHRILLAGCFERDHFDYWYWSGVSLQRLLPNGSQPEFFSFTWPSPEYIGTLVLLPDQRLLLAGDQLARLNPDGSEDERFVRTILSSSGSIATSEIECCVTQPDGKILIGGNFTNIQGHARSHVARMMPDGQLDHSFIPPVSTGDDVPDETAIRVLALQSDGRVLVGGSFESMGGLPYVALARLNSDGSLDTTLPPVFGPDEDGDLVSVQAIALQGEERAIIGGYRLTNTRGENNGNLLRINLGQPCPKVCFQQMIGEILELSFGYSGTNQFSVLTTTNLNLPAANWSLLGSATNSGAGWCRFADRITPSEPRRFYQLRPISAQ